MARAPLAELDDYQLVHENQDVRGWPVEDEAGRALGKVAEMIVDTEEERVTLLRLDTGRELPVADVSLLDHRVLLGRPAGSAVTPTPERGAADAGELRLPVVEERLQVSKQAVEQGGVRVSQRVEERPAVGQVHLREERVEVQHRPVDRPVTEAEVLALQDRTVVVVGKAEIPVVTKQARVVEEVVIRKDVDERAQTVRDTVRRTDVLVEPISSAPRPERGR